MALSEEEQRLLEQLEASLSQDDPRLAQTLGSRTTYRVHRRRAALAGLGFMLGLAGLIVGIQTQWWLSLSGFVLMFVATVLALRSWRKVDGAEEGLTRIRPKQPSEPFTGRLEDRWRRRQNGEL